MTKYCWYDVCCDMTLDYRGNTKEATPFDLLECECGEDYFWKGVAFWRDEEEGEIYFLGVPGLQGETLNSRFE